MRKLGCKHDGILRVALAFCLLLLSIGAVSASPQEILQILQTSDRALANGAISYDQTKTNDDHGAKPTIKSWNYQGTLYFDEDGRYHLKLSSSTNDTEWIYDGKDYFLLITAVDGKPHVQLTREAYYRSFSPFIELTPGPCCVLGRGLTILLRDISISEDASGIHLRGMSKVDNSEIEALLDPAYGYVATRIARHAPTENKDGSNSSQTGPEWRLGAFRRFGNSPYIATSARYFTDRTPHATVRKAYSIREADFSKQTADKFSCDWKKPGLFVEDGRIERGIVYKPGEIPADMTSEELLQKTKKLSGEWIAQEKETLKDRKTRKQKLSLQTAARLSLLFVCIALIIAVIWRRFGKQLIHFRRSQ